MKLIKPVHPETHEILANARAVWLMGEITDEQLNDVVKMCFTAEVEAEVLGVYPKSDGILCNAYVAWLAREITAEQLGDIVRKSFTTELEAAILGDYT